MKDLVTEAAVEAARRGQGCEEPGGCDCAAWVTDGLNAAAPFIAAETLRQAAQKLFADRAARGTGHVSREVSDYLDGIEVSAETLIALADGLEGK